MSKTKKNELNDFLSDNDDIFVFKDNDESDSISESKKEKWRILVIDDDNEVHTLTKLVLSDYIFEGKGLDILSAFSREEAIEVLKVEKNIALILLDVVMETDDAGLKCVKDIRHKLGNNDVRIILRTGQPGSAPERDIIMNYDINDYKAKTELTADKIFTMVTSSLRAYKHIMTISNNKVGLENIISATNNIMGLTTFKSFADKILMQLSFVLNVESRDSDNINSGILALKTVDENSFKVITGIGEYKNDIGKNLNSILSEGIMKVFIESDIEHDFILLNNAYVGYFKNQNGDSEIIYYRWNRDILELERGLLEIFAANIAIAFDNISLGNDIINTQKEIIFTLSEAVEGKSLETANHIRRVAELSCVLANKINLNDSDIDLIRYASAMHDIGKMSTPESILKKPGKLTDDEYEIMKDHAVVGYDIFSKSDRKFMKAAAVIAYHHHERWDGKGYPQGLMGEDIHIYGRIVALADVVDALANDRCYKDAWPIEKVIEAVKDARGKHFEPRLVDVFLESIDEYKLIKLKHP